MNMHSSRFTPVIERESFDYRVVAQTRHAFCVPTLGPIVEGHCLVFSRRQVLNLTQLGLVERASYLEFVRSTARLIECAYGPSILFENGALEAGTSVGCGIDRAHLHIVPGFEAHRIMAALAMRHTLIGQCTSFTRWLRVTKAAIAPYMVVGQTTGPVAIFRYRGARESQCIRRILSGIVERPESWDWRAAKDDATMERTLRTLREISFQ